MSLKLFYSPGACSLVTHIALEEARLDYEPVRVMLAEGEHLKDEYRAINPHARVPALATDRGVITENVAILNFIADRSSAEGSVPRGDPYVTARCNELLGWFASTVHVSFAGIWRAERFAPDQSAWPAIQSGGRAAVERHFAEIEDLCGNGWIAGDPFTAPDSYVATFFRWGRRVGMDMTRYRRAAALVGRVIDRQAVQRVLETEGLKADEFAA